MSRARADSVAWERERRRETAKARERKAQAVAEAEMQRRRQVEERIAAEKKAEDSMAELLRMVCC